ncbi:LOW QUALITY PROTEIN: rab GTPase-binding effector protein 2 [Danio aesculapii]|uniref:LOW QUALITY PROTEIN: rab GTPase-binding effector protein 2 n=1 Tax=Danio aesculapii TaxID=1142201 RepID=UPI0024C0E448|nr:LOW QUALITY PROTEIN: rab GTPase-binding effector protein 2 [Danio aesculapii]
MRAKGRITKPKGNIETNDVEAMEVSDTTTTAAASRSDERDEAGSDVQAELIECRAQLEHWQGVARICELSKQEELQDLQKHCDQEIQSLHGGSAGETAAQYEARISALQSERAQWEEAALPNDTKGIFKKGKVEGTSPPNEGALGDSSPLRAADHEGSGSDSDPLELLAETSDTETTGLMMDYFPQHCDSASLSSFSLDTPSLPRHLPPQDDTASLLSTGTLVPEAIYLPPPGHRLVTHADWGQAASTMSSFKTRWTELQKQKAELERELEVQSTETQKQLSVLQSQVQTSEALLQDLQKSFSMSQNAVQCRLAELSYSQKRVCNELSKLKGEDGDVDERTENSLPPPSPTLEAAHCEERLRIEIVNLQEQLETRTEESEILEVKLASLKVETDRIQIRKEKLEAEMQECRVEVQGLRVALSHLQKDNKAHIQEKAGLQQQCLELRSQVISLRSQLDTSQAVQKDFVQLSQSLQVKLEQIRQAVSLNQVKHILGEEIEEDADLPADAT